MRCVQVHSLFDAWSIWQVEGLWLLLLACLSCWTGLRLEDEDALRVAQQVLMH